MLGALGLLLAASHFALEETHVQLVFLNSGTGTGRPWVVPLVLTCLGVVYVGLGLLLARRGSRTTAPA